MGDDHEVSALFGSGEAMLREALVAKRDECLKLRDRLAEVEARCADVERERDEARERADQWANAIATQRVPLDMARALAAWQAECARLREAMRTASERARLSFYMEAHILLERALASAPGSTDALRAMLKEAATEGINEGYGNGLSYGTERIEAIVSRILGERSDDAPQGRGERGKEGGDE